MKNSKKLVCGIVALLMIVMIPLSSVNFFAAAFPKEGLAFNEYDLYTLPHVPTEMLTFEAEIWIDPARSDRNGTMLGNTYDKGSWYHEISFEIERNGKPRIYHDKYTSVQFTTDLRKYIKGDQFIKIAIAIDRSDASNHKVRLYVNGACVETVENINLPLMLPGKHRDNDKMSGQPLRIGGDYQTGNIRYFKGEIKNITVYSDTRTEEEIKASANAASYSVDAEDASLLMAYDLTSNALHKDLSKNALDLTFSSTAGVKFSSLDDLMLLNKVYTETPHTFAATVYAPVGMSGQKVILGNSSTSGRYINFEIRNGKPALSVRTDEGESVVTFNYDIRKEGWVNLVITHGEEEYRCYIDGVLVDTVEKSVYYDINELLDSTFRFGGSTNKSHVYNQGAIKSVALFTEEFSGFEVRTLNKYGVDAEDERLLAYYNIQEDSSDVHIADISGNGYHFSDLFISSDRDYSEYAYSFAIVGDTQHQTWLDAQDGSSYTANIYDWIIKNKTEKNIQWVIGVGDVTEHDTDPQWQVAYDQMTKLDTAGLPYAVVAGNHDTVAQLDKYFAEDFYSADKVDGAYAEGSLGNYYMTLKVADTEYLLMCLDYGPDDNVLAWAGNIIEQNPHKRVIITTHSYLYGDGNRVGKDTEYTPNTHGVTSASEPMNNGEMIWEKLASQYRNVMMVVCGDMVSDNVVLRQDKGVHGNTVNQFLVNSQGMDTSYSMVCMLYFTEDGKDVAVEWVSAGKSLAAQATDPDAADIVYEYGNQYEVEFISDEGNGILKTEYIKRDDLVDTYRIWYTNGTYEDFTVTNGLDGAPGKDGANGKDGADGKTPYIGENGNWWIGITDTGVSASGGAVAEPDYGNEIIGGECGGNITWMITDKNILVISGNGSMNNYAVGKTPWVDYADMVEKIVIEEGVTTVGKCAFYGFAKVDSVKLPVSLLSIEGYAFYGCSSLKSFTVPANVRAIGTFAFRRSGITSFTLRNPDAWSIKGLSETPDNMDLAGVAAAYATTVYYTYEWRVEEVAVGDVIASGLFSKDLMWTLTTDGTLTVSGNGSMGDFGYNTMPWYDYIGSIFTVIIEDGVTDIGRCAFYGAERLTAVIIPDSVTAIDGYAFYSAMSLEQISVPASVKVIGGFAFAKCPLVTVTFGNTEGWTAGGAAILSSQLLDPTAAAECVALNARVDWKIEEE